MTLKLTSSMDWIKIFYSNTGKWWGPAEVKITDRDYKRLETVKRLYGSLPKTTLELGSSYGNTASVFADAGIDVTAIEISDRADFAKKYAGKKHKGKLVFIKDDFYKINLSQKYDVVCYWNGFGIGTDEDQKKLLIKIAQEWLKPKGTLIMDVQNPYIWKKWNGDKEHKKAKPDEGYNYDIWQEIKYDRNEKRMYDTWWESDKPKIKYTQTIRCYTSKEISSLVNGTGLKIIYKEVKGKLIDWKSHEYLVQLTLE